MEKNISLFPSLKYLSKKNATRDLSKHSLQKYFTTSARHSGYTSRTGRASFLATMTMTMTTIPSFRLAIIQLGTIDPNSSTLHAHRPSLIIQLTRSHCEWDYYRESRAGEFTGIFSQRRTRRGRDDEISATHFNESRRKREKKDRGRMRARNIPEPQIYIVRTVLGFLSLFFLPFRSRCETVSV